MKILFVASELNPLIKVGGLADVVGSLVKEIKQFGHDVRIILPFYQSLKEKDLNPLEKIADISIKVQGGDERAAIYQSVFGNIPLYLVKNDLYISNGDIYLDADKFSSIERFLFFSQAAAELFKTIDWQPDIVHVHDWQTGLIPLLIKIKQLHIKTVFTIHNLLIQGQWNYNTVLEFLGFNGNEFPSLGENVDGMYGKDFNIVQQAILNADKITTVSPEYAKEIKTEKLYSRGLEKEISKRAKDIHGIINGIDIQAFNPETDSYIKSKYSIKILHKKIENKLYLQKKAGISQDKNIPLIGMVTRLDIQKGIDFIASAVDKIVKLGCQIIFLGTGQEKYENMLRQCAKKYPNQVATYIRFDTKLAQQIYAGADMFLMPSRFEPCGLSQMISMRYGTIPIVRATGGLIDTVKNVTVKKGLFGRAEGTGFSFDVFDKKKFIATLKRALGIYSKKKLWRQIQINAMKQDFSWEKSAKKYIALYKQLLK